MRIKKPLKTAGISGIVLLVSVVVFTIINQFLLIFLGQTPLMVLISVIESFVIWGSSILFAYGFIVLGRKYKGKLLVVMSWISIIIAIVILVFSLISAVFSSIPNISAQTDPIILGEDNFLVPPQDMDPMNPGLQEFNQDMIQTMALFIIGWVLVSIILGAFTILFGLGLLKIRDKVEFAKPAAILNIISGATLIILIGWFVAIAGTILEIIMFFNASKKLEK